ILSCLRFCASSCCHWFYSSSYFTIHAVPYHLCSLTRFFFNDPATSEMYTLSLHDALPISTWSSRTASRARCPECRGPDRRRRSRSEEHTSELQSRVDLVCRLLIEK